MDVTFTTDVAGADWGLLKADLAADRFDNGRSPAQLRESFQNSATVALALAGGRVVGTARALSDGVCNVYVVDVWTQSAFRGRGIATRLVSDLLARLPGQHVYLFTDGAAGLYERLGFARQGTGLGLVVGHWLREHADRPPD